MMTPTAAATKDLGARGVSFPNRILVVSSNSVLGSTPSAPSATSSTDEQACKNPGQSHPGIVRPFKNTGQQQQQQQQWQQCNDAGHSREFAPKMAAKTDGNDP